MATDEFESDDEYEFDDFDDFMDDGETEKRPPAGNTREAVEYAVEDVAGGIKDTFTKSELTNNLKTLTSNLAPSALNDEMKKITGIKQALNNELGDILDENKDKVANITGFIMSKTKEGGLINKLASSINSKVVNNEFGDREESVESIASREVSNQLDTAMLEINKAELDNIQKFSQQEALNRIYTQLLKQDAFNKNITTVFYRKSLEYQYISLTTNKRLLDVTKSGLGKIENALSYVVKNTGLPDIVKQRSMEAVTAEARNRMINSGLDKLIGADGWVSKIINKIKSKKQDINDSISGIDEGIDSYKQVDEMSELMAEMGGTSKTRMFASTLPGVGAGVLGKYLGEKLAKTDRGSAAIDKIKDVMSNPSEMLKNVSAKLEGGGNIYTKFIRSKLAGGLDSLADLLEDDAVKSNMLVKTQDLNEAVTLDRKSLITQNEVVPSLLSKILKEVHLIRTGKKEDEVDEVKFDYNARAFSTAKDMTSLLNRKMNTVIDSGGSAKDIATMTKHILKKSGVEFDDKMMGEARSGMASYMLTGKGFKPTDLGDDFFSHFPKEIADIMRAGMENINKADNKTSSAEKTMLRESFSKARGNIPNIEDMINAQINSGNTDLLVRNGLLKYDNKIGRYKVDEKKFNEYVKSALASYQGKGGDYDIKERKGKSIKEDITSLVTGVADFKDNITTNLSMNEFVKNRTNIPMAASKFTLNKSGTNSMVEKLATDAVKGINLAGNKAYENKLVKATVDRIVKDIKSTSNTVGRVVTNTNLYKNAEKMMSDNKEKFTVDYAKEAMTSEIEKLKKEYNSLKDYISNPIEQETNRLTPASTMSNKPLSISKFTLNKSGTNSIAEKLAVDATRASTMAMSKLTESINTLSKNAKETDIYKNLSETYDKHKDVLSVEGVSAELSTLRNELMQFKNNISTNTNLESNRIKPLTTSDNKPLSISKFTLNKSGTNSVAEKLVTDASRASGVAINRLMESMYSPSKKIKDTDTYKALSESYDKRRDVLSVESISAELSSLRDELKQFKDNIVSNSTIESNRIKPLTTSDNKPLSISKFTLNKSGTNSVAEKLAVDANRASGVAINRLKDAISSTSKSIKNTDTYKSLSETYDKHKDVLSVEGVSAELSTLRNELKQFKDNIVSNSTIESNRIKPLTTSDNKPLSISKFTLNKSGTNSVAEKLATDASRASGVAINRLKDAISSTSKSIKNTDTYKSLSETYDKHRDVLSVESISAELSSLRDELKQFKNNIVSNTNIESNRLKPMVNNKPMTSSVFTLNKSGTNSKIESVVTKGIDIATRKAQTVTSKINNVVNNTNKETIIARASEFKKAFTNSNLYKNIDNELKEVGVKLNTSLIRNDDIESTINLTKTISAALDTVKGKVTDASYDIREKAVRELYTVGLIDAKNMIDAITNIERARAREVSDTKLVEKSMYNRTIKKVSDVATFLTKPFTTNKILNKEFNNLAGKVTGELMTVKESKRFNKLKTIVTAKLEKLGISLIKKLNNTQVLELMSIMTASKSIRELKSNTINYLFINDLINESNLMDHMLHINNNAPIDEDIEVPDVTKLSLAERAKSLFKSSMDSRVLANIKSTREQAVTDSKGVVRDIETKLAENEDKRVQSIVTKVIDSLGLSKKEKEKKVSGDTDKDGVRDGSWMARAKNKVFGNKSTEKITTTKVVEDKDKSSNPMWSIAKVLLMGVPMLISGITSISGIISTISTLVGKIPELFKSTIGGLGSKVWKGFKWLSKGVFKLGTRVLTGVGGFLLDVGKTIGGFVVDLGKTIGGIIEGLSKSIWDGFKWVGTKLLDLGKSIAGAVSGAISGAYNSVKSFFSDAVDDATEVIDDVVDGKDKKPNDTDTKDTDKDKKDTDKKDTKDKTTDTKDTDKKDTKDKTTDTKEVVDENDPKHKANKTKGSWWNKIKDAGSSLMKNPLAKKIPVAGAILGAAYGASQLMDGDTVGGLASIGAGIIGSIPVVGTGLSLGVDYAVDKYKQWNPDINKQLYNNQTLPAITTDAADQITLNHIRKHETGKPEGKYGMAGDINDGAGISFGTYQFTEKSGNLKEYLKRLLAITNDPTGQIFLNQFKGDTVYSGVRSGFLEYLKETGDTQAGRYVQDSMYKEIFLDPAKQLGASKGITNQAAMSQLIDHSVNAGLGGAKRMLEIANGDYSPENLARARKMHYTRIIENNPDKEKFRNGWFKRVDANAALYMSEVSKIAATNPAAITTPVNGGVVPNQPLVGPDGKVVQPQTNTGATNTIMNTANAMVTGAMQPQLNAPVAQQPMMTATLAGATQMMSNNQPSSGMNTANLEQILKSSHETLRGIQANTTNLYSSTGPLVVALKTLTESIGKLNETIITNKGSIPNITQKEKTNTPQVIKTPMGEGVSLSKGSSLSK